MFLVFICTTDILSRKIRSCYWCLLGWSWGIWAKWPF